LIVPINNTSNYAWNTNDILVSRIMGTSNYMMNTSNVLAGRINNTSNYVKITSDYMLNLVNSSIYNRWYLNNNMIYYNNYNVGIGTNNPVSKLHLYDDTISETNLTISNSKFEIIPSPNVDISGIITSSTDRYMIFTNATIIYRFTIPEGGLDCDILMIGGGGKSSGLGGGGGAGACIVAIKKILPAGICEVKVGLGGVDTTSANTDSVITVGTSEKYRAKGGGSAAISSQNNGYNGGCGGGAGWAGFSGTFTGGSASTSNVVNGLLENTLPRTTSSYAVLGFVGGSGATAGAGGGGGIGNAGTYSGGIGAYQITLTGASTPINFRSYFANDSTSFGVQNGTTGNYYIGGGGGGYVTATSTWTSSGLGGSGAATNVAPPPNSGSGASAHYNGNGASGIVIIRYRQPISIASIASIASIEFKNFTTNYTIGNTKGNFKITSTISLPKASIKFKELYVS
jgi:hypothetical protein